MDYGGIGVRQHQSPMCLVSEAGEEFYQRLHTQRERFAAVFVEHPKARILLQASTASAWVAQCLRQHEAI
jgi:hypothetical protein